MDHTDYRDYPEVAVKK